MDKLPSPQGTFSDVVANGRQTCATQLDGDVVCWGRGRQISADAEILDLHSSVSCFFRSNRGIECVGAPYPFVQIPQHLHAREIAALDKNVCIVSAGRELRCWGELASDAPRTLASSVYLGVGGACVLDLEGQPTCWGATDLETRKPEAKFEMVRVGNHHACGLDAEGHVQCWKAPGESSIEVDTTEFVDIGVGENSFCGIDTSQQLVCFGTGGSEAAPFGTFTDVAMRLNHVWALQDDGTVIGFEIGTSTTEAEPGVFTAVGHGTLAGSGFGCGRLEDGRVRAFLFQSSVNHYTAPGPFASFSCGEQICGMTDDDRVFCQR